MKRPRMKLSLLLCMLGSTTLAQSRSARATTDAAGDEVITALEGVEGLLDETAEPTPAGKEGVAGVDGADGRASDLARIAPARLDRDLLLQAQDGSATIGLSMKGASPSVAPTKLTSGLVYYRNSYPGTHTAIQKLSEGGTRVLKVLTGPEAPSRFEFPLAVPKDAAIEPWNGGFMISRGEGKHIAEIEAPWAQDANGVQLPAAYKLEGSTLVLDVDKTGAAYPIVVDPSVRLGWNVYVYYTRSEVHRAYRWIWVTVGVAAGTAEICSLIPSKPWQALAAKVACKSLVAAKAYQYIAAVRTAHERNHCMEAKIPYIGGATWMSWKSYNGRYCKN